MNKTTYANFHGVVNVFLVGGCVKSVGMGCFYSGWASMPTYSYIIMLHQMCRTYRPGFLFPSLVSKIVT